MTCGYFFFWSGPLSQWHTSRFFIEDQEFCCAEQYMMYAKAKLFADCTAQEHILKASDPAKQKALGNTVKNFSEIIWRQHREEIVFTGNYNKFSQNKGLRRKLFQTGNAVLVEASPMDTIWGIGLSEQDAKKTNPSNWPGQNLLGRILTKVRERLRDEFGSEVQSISNDTRIWQYERLSDS